MKLRNMNRGIALGVVLAVGTAVYVVVQNSTFKSSEGDIKNVAEEYCQALVKSNVGTGDELEQQWTDLVNDYFVDYTNEYDFGYHKSGCLSEISSMQSGLAISASKGNVVTDAECEISNVTVRKSGATGATVSFSCSAYYEYTGNPNCFEFTGLGTLGDGMYADEIQSKINSYKGTREYNQVTLFMLKTDDGWKIASSSSDYGYYDNMQETSGGTDNTASTDNSAESTESINTDMSADASESTEEVSSLG